MSLTHYFNNYVRLCSHFQLASNLYCDNIINQKVNSMIYFSLKSEYMKKKKKELYIYICLWKEKVCHQTIYD